MTDICHRLKCYKYQTDECLKNDFRGEDRFDLHPFPSTLSINVFNPPHGFSVRHFSRVDLGGRKIGVPQNDLAHDLDGNTRPGGVCCGMSPEIMRPQPNPNFVPCLLDHSLGSFVGYGEDPVMGLNPVAPDVLFEPIRDLLWDEDMLPIFTAFGSLSVSFLSWASIALSFKTSSTLIPPQANCGRIIGLIIRTGGEVVSPCRWPT